MKLFIYDTPNSEDIKNRVIKMESIEALEIRERLMGKCALIIYTPTQHYFLEEFNNYEAAKLKFDELVAILLEV